MPLVSTNFPARPPARKYMLQQEIDRSQVVLGMRDERLATVVHIWKIPDNNKQLRKDLEDLLELKQKELRYLVVDLEWYFTAIDLFKEGDASIEYHVNRALPFAKGQLYKQILHVISVIEERLKPAAPPKGTACPDTLPDTALFPALSEEQLTQALTTPTVQIGSGIT